MLPQENSKDVSSKLFQKSISPMLVSVCKDETREQKADRWRRFFALEQNIKDRLADGSAEKAIEQLHKRRSLSVEQTAFLARAVRLYYFGDLPIENFAAYFVENIGVDERTAQSLAGTLARQVIKKQVKETKERMSIRAALDRFHEIKDQKITRDGLVMAGAAQRMPGTVENWITDYHLAIGQGRHTAIERGNYLFHNRNTKVLTAVDRQRVAMVLKSFDEDMPMLIDTERVVIVFPVAQKVPQRTAVPQRQKQRPAPAAARPERIVENVPQRQKAPAVPSPVNRGNGIMKPVQKTATRTDAAAATNKPMGYVNFSSGQKLSREKKNV